MNRLRYYKQYRDTNIEWLGKIPVHWRITPNRDLFTEIIDRNHPDESLLSVTISHGVMLQNDLISNSSKKDSSNEDKSKYKLVQSGYLVYNKMRAWQGAIGLSNCRGIVSPAYIVVKPRNNDIAKYYHYLFRTPAFMKEAERWSYGITSDQWSLRPQHFKMIYCPVPPPEEQTAIVRFLDFIDNRIKKYIRAKNKMIELLNEQKQAIIQHAFTRGLDPNVRLKPSAVEWLGEIPEHWEVVPFSYAIDFQEGPGIMAEDFRDEGIPLLRISGVQGRWATLEGCNYLDPAKVQKRWKHFQLDVGDLLISASASMGSVCEIGSDTAGAIPYTGLIRLKPIQSVANKDFIRSLVVSYQFSVQIDMFKAGSAIQHYGPTHLRQMKIVLPPLTEQRKIAEYIDSQVGHLGKVINFTKSGIDLMEEYRKALISAVITGKLDVREAAKNLPEEIEDIETMDEIIDEVDDNEELIGIDQVKEDEN
jgi:type I restriction enzyme, S subunit